MLAINLAILNSSYKVTRFALMRETNFNPFAARKFGTFGASLTNLTWKATNQLTESIEKHKVEIYVTIT